ncbi:MAG: hypothetical protein K9J06_04670, partial [Flavobacteriales bacterium]|nr:hypothetical protein [Flavobacteriales bacterium]
MKKLLLLPALLIFAATARAQWNTAGNDIHNTNTGNVGIGNATPAYRLDVNGGLNLSLGNRITIGGNNALHMDGLENVAIG